MPSYFLLHYRVRSICFYSHVKLSLLPLLLNSFYVSFSIVYQMLFDYLLSFSRVNHLLRCDRLLQNLRFCFVSSLGVSGIRFRNPLEEASRLWLQIMGLKHEMFKLHVLKTITYASKALIFCMCILLLNIFIHPWLCISLFLQTFHSSQFFETDYFSVLFFLCVCFAARICMHPWLCISLFHQNFHSSPLSSISTFVLFTFL